MTVADLLKLNVNEHTEKKGNLTYLSWAWAWAEALKADPKANFKVEMFGDKCFMDINGTALVWVTVTLFDKPITCQLPVMDNRNKAITNPDAFQINTAIMRCMTKGLSLHGLGLYIYAGDDLPEIDATVALASIASSQTLDELKAHYTASYSMFGDNKALLAQISKAKDSRKAELLEVSND
jgi:hypothetical protein